MRRGFLTLAILVLSNVVAHAQVRSGPEALSVLIANSPLATQPFGPADVIPVIQNLKLRHLAISGTGAVMLRGNIATSSKAASYPVVAADTGTHFDNIGAIASVTFTLPVAAAGLHYCFAALATQDVVVAAQPGEQIAVGAGNSAAGGNITSAAAFRQGFPSVCLEAHAAGQWIAPSTPNGQWALN